MMDRVPFVQLVRDLVEAMGQQLDAARPIAEGVALRTTDGYLYVFVEDAERVSAESIDRWCREGAISVEQLYVFSIPPAPRSWAPEVEQGGGKLIAGSDFRRLADELGIDSPLVEKDPSIHRPIGSTLPSAQGLDAEMRRAQTWATAGVMPLAAKFYERAARLKPEFLPAWVGLARSQTSLGAWEAAEGSWHRVLSLDPGSLEARMGLASVAGNRGNPGQELASYRAILTERPDFTPARVGLVATLIDQRAWLPARREIEKLLELAPSDPRLRFLHALAMERTEGITQESSDERSRARELGLAPEEEAELARSFGSGKG